MPLKLTNILLVDDDEATNFIHQRLIRKICPQAAVSVFENSEEALQILAAEQQAVPELILLDVNMPAINGWDFLSAMPSEKFKNSLIVLLSTYIDAAKQKKIESFDLNIEFITKPLRLKRLQEVIQQKSPSVLESCLSV